jgi:hypothetical protein
MDRKRQRQDSPTKDEKQQQEQQQQQQQDDMAIEEEKQGSSSACVEEPPMYVPGVVPGRGNAGVLLCEGPMLSATVFTVAFHPPFIFLHTGNAQK